MAKPFPPSTFAPVEKFGTLILNFRKHSFKACEGLGSWGESHTFLIRNAARGDLGLSTRTTGLPGAFAKDVSSPSSPFITQCIRHSGFTKRVFLTWVGWSLANLIDGNRQRLTSHQLQRLLLGRSLFLPFKT